MTSKIKTSRKIDLKAKSDWPFITSELQKSLFVSLVFVFVSFPYYLSSRISSILYISIMRVFGLLLFWTLKDRSRAGFEPFSNTKYKLHFCDKDKKKVSLFFSSSWRGGNFCLRRWRRKGDRPTRRRAEWGRPTHNSIRKRAGASRTRSSKQKRISAPKQ